MTMKAMAAANIEQCLLILLYHNVLAILTVSLAQIETLEKVQNEAMSIILGCTSGMKGEGVSLVLLKSEGQRSTYFVDFWGLSVCWSGRA